MKYLPKNKILKLLAVPAFLFSMSSCDQESVQTLPDRNFEMVWSDEFNGTAGSLPDKKNGHSI
ncbi:hypothetical protein [Chryseobacterium sp. C3]|uniref:hypothetical protein n=1 Tax=Chryseobacterium sp. C3 TaxID=2761532 RepID=UPI001E4DCA75|nr:hypothetical protein [Chryseobacterium sp. C3]